MRTQVGICVDLMGTKLIESRTHVTLGNHTNTMRILSRTLALPSRANPSMKVWIRVGLRAPRKFHESVDGQTRVLTAIHTIRETRHLRNMRTIRE